MIEPRVFERGHALSRTDQPALANLIRAVVDAELVTIVVGAGFSIDAGLPTWGRLVADLARGITSGEVDFGTMAVADADDPMRKAEYVMNMRIKADGYGTTETLVRSALYDNRLGAAPGPLLRALALLVSSLGSRVNILTTNFDELIEQSLSDRDPPVRSKPFLLSSLTDWQQQHPATRTAGIVPIYHLHGRVARTTSEVEDTIVLAESHFLRHGPRVREIVADALRSSVTIFLGLSMTDPNLVGPLWDTRMGRQQCFAVSVPQRIDGYTMSDSRKYALTKNAYLETVLAVQPIFLKSFGQVEQLLREMRVALLDPRRYALPASEPECTAYGARLVNCLADVHHRLGSSTTHGVPTGAKSGSLRDSLRQWIGSSRKPGPLRKLLDEWHEDDETADRLTQLEHKFESPSGGREEFGLQLWVRPRVLSSRRARFEVRLAGASDFAFYPAGGAAVPAWEIDAESDNMAARALAKGRAQISQMPSELSMGKLWRGAFGVPIRIIETISSEDGDIRVPMAVGALVLCTTHSIATERESLDAYPRISIISALDAKSRRSLSAELHSIGQELLSSGASQ